MKERIFQIMSMVFEIPIEMINEKSSHETIESWDSLNHMKLILALEEELGVEFGDDDIVNMKSYTTIAQKIRMTSME